MAIVDETYYTKTFYGLTVASTDFPQFEAWAERVILLACRLDSTTYASISATNQTAVQNAICAQISYYSQYGLEVGVAGISSTGFSVGKVSQNADARFPIGRHSMVCPAAIVYLEQTGLLYNGVMAPDWERW